MRYLANGRRMFGLSVPLGSLRSRATQAVGEYTDLPKLGALCVQAGMNLIQLLPVQDSGAQSSPYSALSAFALHPIYLNLEALPEARTCSKALPAWKKAEKAFGDDARFKYEEVLDAKLAALRAVYEASKEDPGTADAIARFALDRPWANTYALYKTLKELNDGRSWVDWSEYRDPAPEQLATLLRKPELRAGISYHLWVQARCAEQFKEATGRLAAAGIQLLGDLPILMNEDSADVWVGRDNFILGLKAGAPPDMFAELGQNWGFPIYDWPSMEARGLDFWRLRVAEADRYYSAYRIDHVLGFFRIWALSAYDTSGALGRFVPGARLDTATLIRAGFDQARIRWLSEPHLRSLELYEVAYGAVMDHPKASEQLRKAVDLALERVGSEELFRFKPAIRGERDLESLDLDSRLRSYLLTRWRDRVLVPLPEEGIGPGGASLVPAWRAESATAWSTLSDDEKNRLRSLFGRLDGDNLALWKTEGHRLLSALAGASEMLVCAEDLGAVPPGVAETLGSLGMLGLRIPRWTRNWVEAGQPYIPLLEYPELSACAPSVHDTSTLRQWWKDELDDSARMAFARSYLPSWLDVPTDLGSQAIEDMLCALSGAASRLFVTQLQDYLDLSERWRSADPAQDRVNVPGRVDGWNWTWRMPCLLGDLAEDRSWLSALRRVGGAGRRAG